MFNAEGCKAKLDSQTQEGGRGSGNRAWNFLFSSGRETRLSLLFRLAVPHSEFSGGMVRKVRLLSFVVSATF